VALSEMLIYLVLLVTSKLLGIGRIGVNLAVVASAILFKFEAIISFAQLMIPHYLLYFEQHSFHL
jgi:hypothetical protein